MIEDQRAPLPAKFHASYVFSKVQPESESPALWLLFVSFVRSQPRVFRVLLSMLSDEIVTLHHYDMPMVLGHFLPVICYRILTSPTMSAELDVTFVKFALVRKSGDVIAAFQRFSTANSTEFHRQCKAVLGLLRVVTGAAPASSLSLAELRGAFNGMFLNNSTLEARSDVLKCAQCGQFNTTLSKCSRCEVERYCGAECQRAHWKVHKKVCVPLATVEVEEVGDVASAADVLQCATCGRSSCDTELRRCARCEVERYCSAECPRAHWKEHKKVCVDT